MCHYLSKNNNSKTKWLAKTFNRALIIAVFAESRARAILTPALPPPVGSTRRN